MGPSPSASTAGHAPDVSLSWKDDRWLLGAIGALLLLAVIVAATFFVGLPYVRERLSAARWVEHTYEVIGATGEFLLGVQNLESGQQSYLLTRDQAALESYNRGMDLALRSLTRLQQLTPDNPRQQDRLHALHDQMRNLLTITGRANATARGDTIRDAVDTGAADESAPLREAIRHTVVDVAAEEQQLLQQRQAAQADAEQRTNTIFIVLSVTAAAGLLLCGLALAMALRNARSARRQTLEQQRLLAIMNLAGVMVPRCVKTRPGCAWCSRLAASQAPIGPHPNAGCCARKNFGASTACRSSRTPSCLRPGWT
jgi:CHASE3 domain sensor protein